MKLLSLEYCLNWIVVVENQLYDSSGNVVPARGTASGGTEPVYSQPDKLKKSKVQEAGENVYAEVEKTIKGMRKAHRFYMYAVIMIYYTV